MEDAAVLAASAAAAVPGDELPAGGGEALEAWSAFDLDGRRATLDAQALDIATRQETSAASRKALADSTRAFKKGAADGSGSRPVGPLLKAYQAEIDRLTSRAKAAEASFLGVYRGLYEAPDPAAGLAAGLDAAARLAEASDAARRGAADAAAARAAAAATAGADGRVRELEAALAARDSAAASEAAAAAAAAAREAAEAFELREVELLHEVEATAAAVVEAKAATERLRVERDEAAAAAARAVGAVAADHEQAVEELERVRAEATGLRSTLNRLRAEAAGGAGDGDADGGSGGGAGGGVGGGGTDGGAGGRSAAAAVELAAREVEVSQLREQVGVLEAVIHGRGAADSDAFAALSAALKEKDEAAAAAAAELAARPTMAEYNRVREQLALLEATQLGGDDEGEEGEGRDRFRTRTHELEEDNRRLVQTIERLTADVEALKADNVALYGKIRYLQSYAADPSGGGPAGGSGGGGGSLSGAAGVGAGRHSADDGSSTALLSVTTSGSRESLNPYALFKRRERFKRLAELSAPERLTLRASQRALSTRTSRLAVFAYVLGLHMFVFVVLGWKGACDVSGAAAAGGGMRTRPPSA
ncbi:hypothetical protein I4F81_008207 [Pyropia yezoensis]|uniref:Uncharacterized protein n=1 Tax=Pyropia yezoensis TaxID=2788 RepID=A0ACC3C637_PYRYE|nr:hypothetical protein I4F81_008207 [Neopyropia yezoensis]